MITKDDFLKEVLFVLRETFEGSPEGEGSAYLDNRIGVVRYSLVVSLKTREEGVDLYTPIQNELALPIETSVRAT